MIKHLFFRYLVGFRRCAAGAAFAVAVIAASFFGSGNARAENATEVMATGLHISTSRQLTQVQIDLTGEISFTTKVSDTHNIVTVSAKGLVFSLPTGIGKKPKGLVERIRYGKSADGQSEIAIDTNAHVAVRKSYLAIAKRSKRVRLTVVLEAKNDIASTRPEITGSLTPPAQVGPIQAVGTRPLIVIDPGHGGVDPGAISTNGTKEKDVVLAFAKALQSALLAKGSFDVVLTRDGDAFVPLQARVDVARAKQASLFIAVHADTVSEHEVHGTTLYLLSDKASDAEAEALAQKENRADDIGGVDLHAQNSSIVDVLVNLTQRESKNRAAMFAASAVERLKSGTAFTGQPLRSAGFVVLKAPDVPSVLVELGYLSNTQDEKNLLEEGWRNRVAGAFAAAVESHFSRAETAAAQASP